MGRPFTYYIQEVLHAVGQGLFYSADLWSFSNWTGPTFVYDCGASSKAKAKTAVTQYMAARNSSAPVDLLVISHLDRDHVNGIEYLHEHGIGTILIPYVPRVARILMSLRWTSADVNQHLGELLAPVESILDLCDEVLVMVPSEPGAEEDPDLSAPGDETAVFNDLAPLHGGTDEIRSDYGRSAKVHYVTHRGRILLRGVHELRFCCLPLSAEVLQIVTHVLNEEFAAAGLDPLSDDDVVGLLKQTRRRTKLKNRIAQALEDAGYGDDAANRSSVVMLHRCAHRSNGSTGPHVVSFRHATGIFGFDDGAPRSRRRVSSILFGDFLLNQDYDLLVSQLGQLLGDVSLVSLPHHGARKNWNQEIRSAVSGSSLFVASAHPPTYSYSHPHPDVVHDVLSDGHAFVLADKVWTVRRLAEIRTKLP